MHNRDKYPSIWDAKLVAEAELEPLLAERKVHTDEMKKVQLQIEELKLEKVRLNTEAMKDIARIQELNSDIATYAKAMGAKTASGN